MSALLLLGGAEAARQPPSHRTPIQMAMSEASRRFQIPEPWIRLVIDAESGGNPSAASARGALGLMQLMPTTWEQLRARLALGPDPLDVHDNVVAGAAYLREMVDRFGTQGGLAAYNAGPARYVRWRTTGFPLPFETRRYVSRIAPRLTATSAEPQSKTGPSLYPQGAELFPPHRGSRA